MSGNRGSFNSGSYCWATPLRADLRALPDVQGIEYPMLPASADVGAPARPFRLSGRGRVPVTPPVTGVGSRSVRRHCVTRLTAVVALAVCAALLIPSILNSQE